MGVTSAEGADVEVMDDLRREEMSSFTVGETSLSASDDVRDDEKAERLRWGC